MEPVRTCVGCRQRAPRSSLLRVVVREGKVEADVLGRLPGRGAWVHSTLDCVDTATQRRAWARAFRRPGPFDAEPVRHTIGASRSTREQADRPMDN